MSEFFSKNVRELGSLVPDFLHVRNYSIKIIFCFLIWIYLVCLVVVPCKIHPNLRMMLDYGVVATKLYYDWCDRCQNELFNLQETGSISII